MARPRLATQLFEVIYHNITYQPISYCADEKCEWKYDVGSEFYDPKQTRAKAKQHVEETQHKAYVDKINRSTYQVRPEDDDEQA